MPNRKQLFSGLSKTQEAAAPGFQQLLADQLALDERELAEKKAVLAGKEAEREITGGFLFERLKSMAAAEKAKEAQRVSDLPLFQQPGFMDDPRPYSEIERTGIKPPPIAKAVKEKTPVEIATSKVKALDVLGKLKINSMQLRMEADAARESIPTLGDIGQRSLDLQTMITQVTKLRTQAKVAYNSGNKQLGNQIVQEANKVSEAIRNFKPRVDLDQSIAAQKIAEAKADIAERQFAAAQKVYDLEHGGEEAPAAGEVFFQKEGGQPISGRFVSPRTIGLNPETGQMIDQATGEVVTGQPDIEPTGIIERIKSLVNGGARKQSLPTGLTEANIKLYTDQGYTREDVINRYKIKQGTQ